MKEMSVDVKIEARSIFRILAIRTIVDDKTFVSKLTHEFKKLLRRIPLTPRITDKDGHADYLNYRQPHDGDDKDTTDIEKMGEERLCRAVKGFFGMSDKHLGEVVDYQVPLSSSDDVGEGVIDLISKKDKEKEIYIIEAKSWKSPDHPIRAIFEALTFWKMIGGDGNCSNFIKRYNESEKNRRRSLPVGAIAYPAILLYKKSKIYDKMMTGQDFGYYKELYQKIYKMHKLKCFSYDYDKEDGKIKIYDFTKDFGKKLGLEASGAVKSR